MSIGVNYDRIVIIIIMIIMFSLVSDKINNRQQWRAGRMKLSNAMEESLDIVYITYRTQSFGAPILACVCVCVWHACSVHARACLFACEFVKCVEHLFSAAPIVV